MVYKKAYTGRNSGEGTFIYAGVHNAHSWTMVFEMYPKHILVMQKSPLNKDFVSNLTP